MVKLTASAVIAHYSKDINPLREALHAMGVRTVVHSKDGGKAHFQRTNVGRESETYFSYILDQIQNQRDPVTSPPQEDYTIFLQDDAVRHCPRLIDTIKAALAEIETKTKADAGELYVHPPVFFGDVHQGIDLTSASVSRRFHGYPGSNDIKPLFERYFGRPFPKENHWFTAGAQFMIHKSFYLNWNVEKIETYLKELQTHKDPFCALAWERFWPWYILNEKE